MKITNKVNKFYRLVASETDDAAGYQTALTIMMGKPTIYGIIELLRDWSDSPFFRMEDIQDTLLDLLDMTSNRFKSQVDTWLQVFTVVDNSEYISQELRTKIINLIAQHFIKHSELFLGRDYIDMEREPLLTPEILKAAQHRVLLEVMKELQNNDEESWVTALELFQNLILSNKISQNLVEGLAKRFGPEFYGALYSNSRGGSTHTEVKTYWKNKKTLSIWDISEFLGTFLDHPLHSDMIKQMIEKSDDEAKQYWRRLLFASAHYYGTTETFMLDEAMRPMDIEYNKLEWPQEVRILKLNEIITTRRDGLEDFVNNWKRIFGEFGIIPL